VNFTTAIAPTMSSDPQTLYGFDTRHADHWLLWSYVNANAERFGAKTAAVHAGGRSTFASLRTDAEMLAASLLELGVRPGDVVSHQLPNWGEALVIVLAALRIGAVVNPIVPIFRRHETGFMLRECESRLIFVPGVFRGFDHAGMARDLMQGGDVPQLKQVITCRASVPGLLDFDSLMKRGHAATLPPLARGHDVVDRDAFLLYTSGTSGNPKGVRHSQRTLVSEAVSLLAVTGLTDKDIGVMASTVGHVTGAMYSHVLPQVAGSTVCLMEQWTPKDAAELIAREGCTWMSGATPFLQGLMVDPDAQRNDMSSFNHFRCGGAQVPPQLIRDAIARGIHAVRCYGATEYPTVSGISWGDPEKAATTDGQVHEHVEIRIVDLADESRVLGPGEPGEVLVRGPERFLGYRDARHDRDGLTADGWYRTGDIGFVDAERYLTISGRRKDIIIRKGENISAREVEDALAEHPSIAEVAIIGVPDAERGEMVTAVCVAKPAASAALTLAGIAQFLEQAGFARQKTPERLEIVAAMPMTAAGKIRKDELRTRFGNRKT
jgi:cyclohexanecarboxylate-CoA ligase